MHCGQDQKENRQKNIAKHFTRDETEEKSTYLLLGCSPSAPVLPQRTRERNCLTKNVSWGRGFFFRFLKLKKWNCFEKNFDSEWNCSPGCVFCQWRFTVSFLRPLYEHPSRGQGMVHFAAKNRWKNVDQKNYFEKIFKFFLKKFFWKKRKHLWRWVLCRSIRSSVAPLKSQSDSHTLWGLKKQSMILLFLQSLKQKMKISTSAGVWKFSSVHGSAWCFSLCFMSPDFWRQR